MYWEGTSEREDFCVCAECARVQKDNVCPFASGEGDIRFTLCKPTLLQTFAHHVSVTHTRLRNQHASDETWFARSVWFETYHLVRGTKRTKHKQYCSTHKTRFHTIRTTLQYTTWFETVFEKPGLRATPPPTTEHARGSANDWILI